MSSGLLAQKLITPGYLFNSDPTCREIDGQFYLFTTQDPFSALFETDNKYFKGMYAYHAYSTTDFDHWIDHGSILTARDAAWNTGGALWDGDAGIPANGRFYAYAPFRVNSKNEANYGRYDVGVFVARDVNGPYHDVFEAPMKDTHGVPLEGLSPAFIKGNDGSPYLIWGSGDTEGDEATVMLARLKQNMVELAEPPRHLAVQKRDKCGNLEYFESPLLFNAGSKWYLTYVAYKDAKGPGCDQKGFYIDYAVSDSMFGPFDAPAGHLIYPGSGGVENVQQGVCQFRNQWYLAYHVPYKHLEPYKDHHRQVAITKLTINSDGSLEAVYPDHDVGAGSPGITSLTLDAFAARREAAEFQIRAKAKGERGLSGEYQFKMKDGSYLQFHNMNFGAGASGYRVEVSSENPAVDHAILQFRLDNPQGKLIATAKIGPGLGRTTYKTIEGAVDPGIRGIHDICLVARGAGDDPKGNLFNITWFTFVRK